MYTYALDRKAIQSTTSGLVRIDLQLLKRIEDARSRLAAMGINIYAKVFMEGLSASGSFVSRFVMLHPEVIKAASVGSPGWGPAVPVGGFDGQTLPNPEGISDLQALVGQPFNETTLSKLPQQASASRLPSLLMLASSSSLSAAVNGEMSSRNSGSV
jgi:hypothetical protein